MVKSIKLSELAAHRNEIQTIPMAEAKRRQREEALAAKAAAKPSRALAVIKGGKRESAPAKPKLAPIQESVAKLATVADRAMGLYELPNFFALANETVNSVALASERHDGSPLSPDKRGIKVLEAIMAAGAVGVQKKTTRWRSLLGMLRELKATQEGQWVRLGKKKAQDGLPVGEKVESQKAATDLLTYFEAYSGEIEERALESLDAAKRLPIAALRSPLAKEKAIACPDIGVPFALAVLEAGGWNSSGFPVTNLLISGTAMLEWMETMLLDLQQVIEVTDDQALLRARLYGVFADNQDGEPWTEEEVIDLLNEYAELNPPDWASAAARKEAQARKDADAERYKEITSKFALLLRDIDAIQEDAAKSVADVLVFVRAKLADKAAYAERKKAEREAKKAATPTSTKTVEQAVEDLRGVEVEVEISAPPLYGAALGIATLDERRRTIEMAGLGVPRVCSLYDGVVWEVIIGPLYNALDIEKQDRELMQVVIAPRRVGGLGAELSEARVIALSDFEDYFEVVEE